LCIITQAGDPTPSQSDFLITDRIYESSNIMGIELLDHIIIGDGTYQSIFGNTLYINNRKGKIK